MLVDQLYSLCFIIYYYLLLPLVCLFIFTFIAHFLSFSMLPCYGTLSMQWPANYSHRHNVLVVDQRATGSLATGRLVNPCCTLCELLSLILPVSSLLTLVLFMSHRSFSLIGSHLSSVQHFTCTFSFDLIISLKSSLYSPGVHLCNIFY